MRGATIAFTGGGTGGHVYPGLAVAQELRGKGFDGRIAWIGSTKNSDRAAVAEAGLEYYAVPSGKLRRDLSLRNLSDAFRVLAGYSAARGILKELRPAILFSKGGYVSVPPCAAAASLGIPYLTHESDLTPGLATRLNSRRAERILVSYEETIGSLREGLRAKALVTGNPVRDSIRQGDASRGRAALGLNEGLPIVFFLGGSQGARQINELAAAVLPRLKEAAFVLHQTGPEGVASEGDGPRYKSFAYARDELPDLLAAADLVVGRAGAGTLWESAALGKPMVLVPLCGADTRGDQVDNAALFARAGAAVSLVGAEATPARLAEETLSLLADPARLAAAGRACKALAGGDAASLIADLILERIGGTA